MSFFLRRIVLYNRSGDQRILTLNRRGLSVVTGDPGTGKSSLIDIVNYCLGSKSCPISDGDVLKTVAWYAIDIEVQDARWLVARRAPSQGRQTSSEFYVTTLDEVGELSLPAFGALESSVSLDGTVEFLTDRLAIPPTQSADTDGFPSYNITVRHAARFLFQKQYELNSPKFLFHDETESIQASIRETLPFFLGAVDIEDVQRSQRLAALRRQGRRLRAKLQELESLVSNASGRLRSLIREASDAGLTSLEELPSDRDAGLTVLRSIKLHPENLEVRIDDGSEIQGAARTLSELVRRQSELRRRLTIQQEQLESLGGVTQFRLDFTGEVREQENRLICLDLVPSEPVNGTACPMCDQRVHDDSAVADMRERLGSLRHSLEAFASDPPELTVTTQELRDAVEETRTELSTVSAEIAALETARERNAEIVDIRARQALVVGRVSLYLESVRDYDQAEILRQRLTVLDLEIDELVEEVSSDRLMEKLDDALAQLAADMTNLIGELELEYSGSPLRLDLRRVTVVSYRGEGAVPLKRMGGGENIEACHVVAHLALHRFFSTHRRPVPRFLFLDQPSQVYFPSEDAYIRLAEGERTGDLAKAERLLRLINDACSDHDFQVIVTEHADIDEEWYRRAKIEPVWRNGLALIPSSWKVEDSS